MTDELQIALRFLYKENQSEELMFITTKRKFILRLSNSRTCFQMRRYIECRCTNNPAQVESSCDWAENADANVLRCKEKYA
jgi:hypothetical protein